MQCVSKSLLAMVLLAPIVYGASACHETSTSEPAATNSDTSRSAIANPETSEAVLPSTPPGIPEDYFPFTPGLRLEYRVTLGKAEPLNFETIEWPMGGNHEMVTERRGRFIPPVKKAAYSLILQIVGPAEQQGPYSWDGVKVNVVKDELGIFDDVRELFWNRTRGGDLNALEVRTYSPGAPGAPMGPWGVPESGAGSSSRIIFFGGHPGGGRSLGSADSDEEIGFVGLEGDRLHFVRMVKVHKRDPSDTDEDNILNQAFEEHTWFGYGRGMVRLEQRVNGVTSMTWELVGGRSAYSGHIPTSPAVQ